MNTMNIRQGDSGASRRGWRTFAAWVLLIGGLGVAFGHTFAEMWLRWFPAWQRSTLGFYDRIVEGESYYTHGPIVPMVALLIVLLLIRHTKIPVRPRRFLGLMLLLPSLLLHLTACLARVNFASGFALIGVLGGLVLFLWGATALRRLLFPLAMLAFMAPLPEVTIARLNFYLKMFAADWGVRLVNVIGVMAERSGNRVFLEGDKILVIANVCNGLRTLISLLAFGAVYAYVCKLRGFWRLLLFAMSVPVAVVSNSLRITSLIVVADLWDVQTATGWYHDISGILIFVLAFFLMFGLERLILWLRELLGRPAKVFPLFHDVRLSDAETDQWPRLAGAIRSPGGTVAVVLVMLTAAGTWHLNHAVPQLWNQQMAQKALPRELVVAGRLMTSCQMEMDEKTLTILETRDYLLRRYFSPAGTPPIDLCIIFSQDNRKGTHPPDLCLQGSGEGIVASADVAVPDVPGRGDVSCRELVVQVGNERHYYIYTYKCGSRYTGSFWTQQFTIFTNGLLRRNSSGAMIRVSTSAAAGLDDARRRTEAMLRSAIPHLDRELP